MSEATTKLRAFKTYSVGVRDLAADAIEAVEAQVAEAVARVEKLEKRPTIVSAGSQDDDRVEPAPVRRFKVGDRVRFVAEPRCTSRGYVGRIGTVKRVGDVPSGFDYNIIDIDGRGSIFANDSDLEPAPSAVPEPRGFRVGDVVRHREFPGEDWTVSEVMEGGGLIHCTRPRGWVFRAESRNLTLVRAAAAPEAPAEGWKACAEAADIRADGHAEGLRSIRKMLTQSPPDVDRAILWCDDSLSGYTQSVAATEAETNDRALAAEARAEAAEETQRLRDAAISVCATSNTRDSAKRHRLDRSNPNWSHGYERVYEAVEREMCHRERAEAAEKERDTWKSEAEQRLKTLKFEGARAEALAKDLAEARAISATTAERARNETQSATELRKDLADANGARDRLVRELSGERVERDYWKIRAEDVTKEWDALRAELDTLKAKPRFRTRKVTAADARALDDEWAKSKYVGRNSWVLAMNALGFRRRVDGDS